MGFETCRMTCEETPLPLVDMLRPPKTGTMKLTPSITATWVHTGSDTPDFPLPDYRRTERLMAEIFRPASPSEPSEDERCREWFLKNAKQISRDLSRPYPPPKPAPPKSRGEEIAERLCTLVKHPGGHLVIIGGFTQSIYEKEHLAIVEAVAAAIDKAIAEEREACAEIVRRFCGDIGSCDADRIAKAIRERGTK